MREYDRAEGHGSWVSETIAFQIEFFLAFHHQVSPLERTIRSSHCAKSTSLQLIQFRIGLPWQTLLGLLTHLEHTLPANSFRVNIPACRLREKRYSTPKMFLFLLTAQKKCFIYKMVIPYHVMILAKPKGV